MTNKKKKIVVLAIVAVIVVMVVAGATIAYFTDTKTVTNTFTMGNVKITVDETNPDDPEGARVTENNEYEADPGQTVTKDPIIHNTGDNGAYVRAKVTICDWENQCAKYFPETEVALKDTLTLVIDELGENWSILSAEVVDAADSDHKDVVFTLKYDKLLEAGKDTSAMFTEVTVPAKMDNNDAFGPITVKAEAIQSNGFDSWDAAFAAFDAAE